MIKHKVTLLITEIYYKMGTKNLGNVAGVVKGLTPPLESDGSEKRYVLWA